jgi:hypothetical protein
VIQGLRRQIEDDASTGELRQILDDSNDGSLERMALAVVKLFIFLRVKFLDLRQVARLFAQRKGNYKTTLRKLYTVSVALELAGIIRKTSNVSEIQLRISLDSRNTMCGMGLRCIVNTKEELAREQICEKRRKEFRETCRQLSRPAPPPRTPGRPLLPPLMLLDFESPHFLMQKYCEP